MVEQGVAEIETSDERFEGSRSGVVVVVFICVLWTDSQIEHFARPLSVCAAPMEACCPCRARAVVPRGLDWRTGLASARSCFTDPIEMD